MERKIIKRLISWKKASKHKRCWLFLLQMMYPYLCISPVVALIKAYYYPRLQMGLISMFSPLIPANAPVAAGALLGCATSHLFVIVSS